MEKIELKAYGKINLGLDVIRKRPDGYHDLDMIMQMVDVYDDIVITKNKTGKIEVRLIRRFCLMARIILHIWRQKC